MRLTNIELEHNTDGTFDVVGLDERGEVVTLMDCQPVVLEDGSIGGVPLSAKGEFVIRFTCPE